MYLELLHKLIPLCTTEAYLGPGCGYDVCARVPIKGAGQRGSLLFLVDPFSHASPG